MRSAGMVPPRPQPSPFNEACPEGQDEMSDALIVSPTQAPSTKPAPKGRMRSLHQARARVERRTFNEACPEGQDEMIQAADHPLGPERLQRSLPRRAG
mgnify:CR=1 FL=1